MTSLTLILISTSFRRKMMNNCSLFRKLLLIPIMLKAVGYVF
ncbi:hypothetical protein T10_10881 [Trichinella papuae]|uniref:Uncharacterized protein n=1 Tax=Trichinella papuae TaxID=268474 RepID=A0A0V1LXZ6_9BILA|nr:hypothetical protein T10_10881 [Trichinella papuae]